MTPTISVTGADRREVGADISAGKLRSSAVGKRLVGLAQWIDVNEDEVLNARLARDPPGIAAGRVDVVGLARTRPRGAAR